MTDRGKSREQLISELNRLRKAEEERERLTAILEATSDIVATAGPEGRFTYINIAGRKLLGWKPGEKKDINDVHPQWAAEIIENVAVPTCLKDGIWEGETAILGKDGQEIPVSQVLMSHQSPDGKLDYFSTIMRDISHSRQAEKDLSDSETRFRNIVERSPMGIFIYRQDQENRLIFSGSNPAADIILGIDNKRHMGETIEVAFPPLAETEVPDRYPRTAAEGIPWQTEEIAYHDREIAGAFEVYAFQTEPGAMAAMFLDITERVHIEEMMIQSEKMLTVGGLAAGMAHEINNPLAGILQNVQVIQNRFKTDLSRNRETALRCDTNMEAVRKYVEQRGIVTMMESVMESGRRAAKIVDNMLSFSRKSESKMVPHDLEKLLDKTVELASNDYDLKKKYDFRSIQIIRQFDDDIPSVKCEYSKIQQVFLNILNNGAQAMAQSRAERNLPEKPAVYFRLKKEDRMVRVEIEDNGPGMEENVRKRIFEPFFTTKGVGIGTGLGLSVSYFIITENHKGTMAMESSPGKGTTFILRLPIEVGGQQ